MPSECLLPRTREWACAELEFADAFYERAIEGMLPDETLPPQPLDFLEDASDDLAKEWEVFKTQNLAEFMPIYVNLQPTLQDGTPNENYITDPVLRKEAEERLDALRNFFNCTLGKYFDFMVELTRIIRKDFPDIINDFEIKEEGKPEPLIQRQVLEPLELPKQATI